MLSNKDCMFHCVCLLSVRVSSDSIFLSLAGSNRPSYALYWKFSTQVGPIFVGIVFTSVVIWVWYFIIFGRTFHDLHYFQILVNCKFRRFFYFVLRLHGSSSLCPRTPCYFAVLSHCDGTWHYGYDFEWPYSFLQYLFWDPFGMWAASVICAGVLSTEMGCIRWNCRFPWKAFLKLHLYRALTFFCLPSVWLQRTSSYRRNWFWKCVGIFGSVSASGMTIPGFRFSWAWEKTRHC